MYILRESLLWKVDFRSCFCNNYSLYLDVRPAEALACGDVTLVVVGAPGVTVTSLAAIGVRLRQPVMLRQTLNTKVSRNYHSDI